MPSRDVLYHRLKIFGVIDDKLGLTGMFCDKQLYLLGVVSLLEGKYKVFKEKNKDAVLTDAVFERSKMLILKVLLQDYPKVFQVFEKEIESKKISSLRSTLKACCGRISVLMKKL